MRREKRLVMAAAVWVSLTAAPGWVLAAAAQAPETRPETTESREQYSARVEREIKNLGARIEELARKAEAAGGEVKKESKNVLKELGAKKDALERRLEALKSSSGKAWGDVKSGLDEALDDVHKSLDKAKKRFP